MADVTIKDGRNLATDPNAKGTVGLETQVPGAATSVSNIEQATGGMDGDLIVPDLDEELFKFKTKTALYDIMLKAKLVQVKAAEVEHYMIDEPKAYVSLGNTAVTKQESTAAGTPFSLTLVGADKKLAPLYTTLTVNGIKGYDAAGNKSKADLMLYVVGKDTSGNPTVICVNGKKASGSDDTYLNDDIPANSKLTILGNACSETQQNVAPDAIVPKPRTQYLQKRIMNQIVSDYYDSQKKKIPFAEAIIAEAAIANFKARGNRTLWNSAPSKFLIDTNSEMGDEYVYTTEGVRSQFMRELQHSGRWTYEQFIGLAKMFYAGEDTPDSGICLCGKNVLEQIQCIDFSSHPEVYMEVTTNQYGWSVTKVHTVFGDLEFKHEPTLDFLNWENSFAILDPSRLVHYQRVVEHKFNEKVEGREAKRSGVIVWDALSLKGSCHIFVDGDATTGVASGSTTFAFASKASEVTTTGVCYYLLADMTLGTTAYKTGEIVKKTSTGYEEYTGEISF